VVAGQHHFFRIESAVITAARQPSRLDPSKWLSDNIRRLIYRCQSPSLSDRPDPNAMANALGEAGDIVELRSRGIMEADLADFLKNCVDGGEGDGDAKKAEAQQIVDSLSLVGRSEIDHLR
jgi:hypothetical protein